MDDLVPADLPSPDATSFQCYGPADLGLSGIGLLLKSINTLRNPSVPLNKEPHTGAAPL